MSISSSDLINDDQYHIALAQNLIASCSQDGLNYSLIKNILDNSLNKITDVIISFLHDKLDDESYQNEIKSIKILPFRKLAEEIQNFKQTVTFSNGNFSIEKLNFLQKQEEKLNSIQDLIVKTAKQSNSSKIKSILNLIDDSEISQDTLKELFLALIQEGENIAQTRMANLWENVFQTFNSSEKVDKSIPIDQSEKLILETVQSIKKKVNHFTQKSLKTNLMQTQLISTLELQIEDLKKSLKFQNEAQLFETDIRKKFEEFENNENKKFDQLFRNYKEAFQKIEEVTKSKNELLLRNGNLETQNLLLQQKFNASINENNKLKQTIQNFQLKNRKSP